MNFLNTSWLDRSEVEWAYRAWDGVLQVLCSIAVSTDPDEDLVTHALQEAELLVQVDLQMAHNLDLVHWLTRSEVGGLDHLSPEAWRFFIIVIVHLCSRGALLAPAVLEAVVYPRWNMGDMMESTDTFAFSTVAFDASCTLFRALVIDADVKVAYTHPQSNPALQNIQLRAYSGTVFEAVHFEALLLALKSLKSLKNRDKLNTERRQAAADLLDHITQSSAFRLSMFSTAANDFLSDGDEQASPTVQKRSKSRATMIRVLGDVVDLPSLLSSECEPHAPLLCS